MQREPEDTCRLWGNNSSSTIPEKRTMRVPDRLRYALPEGVITSIDHPVAGGGTNPCA